MHAGARGAHSRLVSQMVLELAEVREIDTARAILRATPTMTLMKQEQPERYLRLERLLNRNYFDYAEVQWTSLGPASMSNFLRSTHGVPLKPITETSG